MKLAECMFRVKSYGDSSFFRRTKNDADVAAQEVLQRNGCGCIEQKQESGLWKLVARFEPWYGIVAVN